jgi:N-acetylglucosaminyldiphosphoundecaprenol N-acetyl-beta-D-mannosaminyltransferase
MAETKDAIKHWITSSQRPAAQIATVNLDFLALGERNPTFKNVLLNCELVLADGMGVVWLSKLAGRPIPERVAGADLVAWLVDGGIEDARLFLLGSTPEAVGRIRDRAQSNGGTVVGSATPLRSVFESDLQSARIVDQINQSNANVLLLALGPPLQEIWIERWLAHLEVEVAIGVGASLDFAAGTRPRAPLAWQRLGVEWLYRLLREPRRLWKRYLRRDVPFFVSEGLRSVITRREGLSRVVGVRLLSHDADQGQAQLVPSDAESDLHVSSDHSSLTIDLTDRSNVRASAETR